MISFLDKETIQSWKKTQDNGIILYEKFPEYNLTTEDRKEVHEFKKFCSYHGNVLDVGSGLEIPSYLKDNDRIHFAIGTDPLVIKQSNQKNIILLKAIGEFLPVQDDFFDCVSFATSFDHVIDPVQTLMETKRVLKKGGSAIFWVDKEPEKRTIIQRALGKAKRTLFSGNINQEVSRITEQNIVINSIENIPNAVDKFHLKHIRHKEFIQLAESSGFRKVGEEIHTEIQSVFLKFTK
jgi:SAM-dependent methyltransferase